MRAKFLAVRGYIKEGKLKLTLCCWIRTRGMVFNMNGYRNKYSHKCVCMGMHTLTGPKSSNAPIKMSREVCSLKPLSIKSKQDCLKK